MKSMLRKHKAMFIMAVVLIAVYLFCMFTGIRLCAVQSGSMEPNIPTYSMCLVTTHVDYDELQLGDVVVFTKVEDGRRIIHRIVAFTDDGAVTKGDANSYEDGPTVRPDTLYGKYIAHVPYVANVYNIVRSPIGVGFIVILAVAIFVMDEMETNSKNNGKSNDGTENKV